MKILTLALAGITATAPVAATADQRHYAHRHHQPQYQQQYHQPQYGHQGYGYGYRQSQKRAAEIERQRRNARLVGGLVVLGLVLNAYNNKRD